MLGHVTYQAVLEKTFRESIPEVDFLSLNHLQPGYADWWSNKVYAAATLRIPVLRKDDRDLFRLRAELAMSYMATRQMKAFLQVEKADVVHLHTQAIGLLAPGAFGGLPYVVSLDNTTALLLRDRGMEKAGGNGCLISLEQRCFQSAAHVVSFTERARRSVVEDYGIDASKVSCNYPCVPLEPLLSVPRPGKPGERVRLLFVGNDFVRKGGEELLAVFLEDLKESCELDIVSNDLLNLPDLPQLRQHRGLKPLSPELLRRYEEADIFVMPTREDCMGWVFIEANAAGLPSVASNVMAVPEMVREGVNGLTVPARNPGALKEAIKKLVENPDLRLEMGSRARVLARTEFDPLKNFRRLADIFMEAARTNER